MRIVVKYDNISYGRLGERKSTQGIKAAKHKIDLIAARVQRLKEMQR